MNRRPLDGIRVLELGQLMAGPFAGTLLAYYGAEVIKVEPPGLGDPVRRWRIMDEGTSLWWRTLGRNKKCITVDLRQEAGREIVRDLARKVDVLVENFRPGTLEKWGLAPQDIQPDNPELIYARVSGYGQTGPYASRPGYASVCEGVGGLRYVNGFPGDAPVRQNLSLGDSLTGLHAAFGVLLALLDRQRQNTGEGNGESGQVIDVGIFESVFNMMEAVVPEYDRCGIVREPSGSTITGIVPTNIYPTADSKYVIIGGSGDSIYKRLMTCAGRQDLAEDPRLASNEGRVRHQQEVDSAIAAWTKALSVAEILERLEEAVVPAGPIYDVKDMLEDEHFQARGLFEEVEVGGKPLKIPAIVPKLSATPGRTDWPGPEVGAHNHEVLEGILGLSSSKVDRLKEEGVL
ncbi:MAG: CoA transferase [Deltaproteobacteria bacterium]|nr:CoA transferase [Deltaproteobacteria bacterium]